MDNLTLKMGKEPKTIEMQNKLEEDEKNPGNNDDKNKRERLNSNGDNASLQMTEVLEIENTQIISVKQQSCLSLKGKKPVGLLILISSAIHNIMDGIALGIVFSSRKIPVIVSTTVAIALHEIPKELGDAGILIHANFNIWSVLFWNSIINLTAILGAIIGLTLGNMNESSESYAMGYVAGNFFFISLAEMIPVILHKKGLWENIIQFIFMMIGLAIMFLILLLEAKE